MVNERQLHNALVLVAPCPGWGCYGSVFWINTPDLDGDVVFAKSLGPQQDAELMRHYAGRAVYRADYNRRTLEPVTGPSAP